MNILLLKKIFQIIKENYPENKIYLSSSGHLLLLGKTSKKFKILLFSLCEAMRLFCVALCCSKLILITTIQFPQTKKKIMILFFHTWNAFYFYCWLRQNFCEIVDEIHRKAGKAKENNFFFISTEPRAEQRHEYFSSDVHVWLNMLPALQHHIFFHRNQQGVLSSAGIELSGGEELWLKTEEGLSWRLLWNSLPKGHCKCWSVPGWEVSSRKRNLFIQVDAKLP